MNRLVLILTVCFSVYFACADGCYLPQIAVQKIPDIPAQQALIVWRDGTETLVISSALDSESQKLGWIIPLPSVPESIEKASPGILKTLSLALQPEITHDLFLPVIFSIKLLLLANILLAMYLYSRVNLVVVLTVLLIVVIFSAALFPASSSGGGATACVIHEEKTAHVGAYDVAVLRAHSTIDLNGWLFKKGLSTLPLSAEKTFADYIREGWIFATISLSREQTGANAPHPIRLSFKAKEPIYPMKLTALAGGTTRLELFVVSNQRAACVPLETEFCDTFVNTPSTSEETRYEPGSFYMGRVTREQLGHAGLCGLLWDGCILTKLSGSLTSAQMSTDLHFHLKSFTPYQQHFFTTFGAECVVTLLLLWGIGGTLFVSMIAFSDRIRQPHGIRWLFGKIVLPVSCATVMVCTVFHTQAPKLNPSDVRTGRFIGARMRPLALLNHIYWLLEKSPSLVTLDEWRLANTLLDQLNKSTTSSRRYWGMNPATGGELEIEDSPGNFTVEKQDGKIIVSVYDSAGRAWLLTFPK